MVIIYSLIVLIIYHFTLLTFPMTAFLLPIFKIKKLGILSKNKRRTVEILVMGILLLLSPQLLGFYLIFFFSMENLYLGLKKTRLKEFDRMILATIIILVMVVGVIYYNRDELIQNFQYIFEIYQKKLNLDLLKVDFSSILYGVKSNLVYYTFVYVFFNICVLHLYFEKINNKEWEISFYWILLYIIPFFLLRMGVENIYLKNLLNIIKVIYYTYGITALYSDFTKKSKIKLLGLAEKNELLDRMLILMIIILFYRYMFIIGVVYSYFYKPSEAKNY